jgi:DNA-binding transcriptional ArsR family regulator
MSSEARSVELDAYVVDVLMRDLVGHDQAPSAFIVFVYFAVRSEREMTPALAASYGTIASATGLSKSAVQHAVARLKQRRLISAEKDSPTATPRYRLHRHWRLRARRPRAGK